MTKKSKLRVGARVKDAVGVTKSRNRSEELEQMRKTKFPEFQKKLRAAINAAEEQRSGMIALSKARSKLASSLSSITKETPLHKCVGEIHSPYELEINETPSYADISYRLATRTEARAHDYMEGVIDYAQNLWRIMDERVCHGSTCVDRDRFDLNHYENKVAKLGHQLDKEQQCNQRARDERTKARHDKKVKQLKATLTRNQEKLQESRETYEASSNALLVLLEEYTARSWRDVLPLLINMVQTDQTWCSDEIQVLGSLGDVQYKLEEVARRNNVDVKGRLGALKALPPEDLSTGNQTYLSYDIDLASTASGSAALEPVPAPPYTSVWRLQDYPPRDDDSSSSSFASLDTIPEETTTSIPYEGAPTAPVIGDISDDWSIRTKSAPSCEQRGWKTTGLFDDSSGF